MTRYLLPCRCGRRLPVTTAQAGDQLECECGERLEVPTLRHLTSLERLEETAPSRQKTWGLRQSLVFLGAAIVVIAATALVALQITKPQPIREPILVTQVDKMTPQELWKTWLVLQQGVKRLAITPFEATILQQNRIQIEAWAIWQIVVLVIAAIGGLLIVLGLSLRAPRRKGPQTSGVNRTPAV